MSVRPSSDAEKNDLLGRRNSSGDLFKDRDWFVFILEVLFEFACFVSSFALVLLAKLSK